APMRVNYGFGEIQTEACTLSGTAERAIDAEEAIKDFILVAFVDANPLIAHIDGHNIGVDFTANRDRAPIRRIFYGVVHQIVEYLPNAHFVRRGNREIRWKSQFKVVRL